MRLHPTDLPRGKNQNVYNTSKIFLFGGIAFVCFTVAPLYSASFFMRSSIQSSWSTSSAFSSSNVTTAEDSEREGVDKKCDLFKGEWVPNPDQPYYTNETCSGIFDHQNCMKFGRPDTDFIKWRWKPDDCELPVFDPTQFLELARGKSLAFVGDSVGRNHMQSLMCLLSRVESPVELSNSTYDVSKRWKDQQSKQWRYNNHNFTIANFWSPLLVKETEDTRAKDTVFTMHLSEADEKWANHIEKYDYVIISAGHWFFRPSIFYEESQLVACHHCPAENVTSVDTSYGYRKAFRTALKAIYSLKNFKGVTFLRTFAPSHFENGSWYDGGNCVRRKPFMRNETHLDGSDLELYMAQLDEFKVAEEQALKRGLKFRLLDTTRAMLMRPDGHPSHYGHEPHPDWPNDCVHWCLPGPIDTWNDLLLEMLNRER
ncbi:hypothetical protein ACHQM5_006867 [Ranunculus cassubicifolius]